MINTNSFNPLTYKSTLMQKLLGRNYKWWYVVKFYRNSQLTYNSNSIFHSLASITSFLLMLLVWYIGLSQNNNQISYNYILTYFFIAYIYTGLTPMWICEMLGYRIQDGRLTTQLLSPSRVFWIGVCEMLGRGFITASIIVTIPFFLILPFFYNSLVLPNSIWNYLVLILFLPSSFFIKYTIDFIVGCLAFWSTNNGGILSFYGVIVSGLNGTRIPLELIKKFIPIVTFLPTAYIISNPIELFFKLEINNFISSLSVSFTWCIILYLLANFIFKKGLKRNEVVGL